MYSFVSGYTSSVKKEDDVCFRWSP